MRDLAIGLCLLLLSSGLLAGCLNEGASSSVAPPVSRRGIPVVNLNASLLDTAQFAADERFGPDRELTLADLPNLLPKALTNYNVTLDYILNMSRYPNIGTYQIGETLTGRAIFGLVMTDDGQFHDERPTLMFTCSQHGNEPSGSEACLVFIEYFTHGTDAFAQDVRTKLNVIINPLANPDGKEGRDGRAHRGNYDQVDINRDHMNLATLEGRAIHNFANMFDPEIALDLHEFGGAGASPADLPMVTTWQTFQIGGPEGAAQNDPNLFNANWEMLRHTVQRSSEKFKYGSTGYYGSPGTSGGSAPSVHRHYFPLINCLSLLFETGGGGGVTNLGLRVNHHIVASFAVIEWFFANQARVMQVIKDADGTAMRAEPGVQGWVVPPQKDQEKAKSFLDMHGVNFTILDKDTSFQVLDYRAGAGVAPQTKSFPNGTVLVKRWQPEGRLANEIFENEDDAYYNKGPRAWPLEAYRIVST